MGNIWENIIPYLLKKCLKYNWILNRPKDLEKSPNNKVEVFVWWAGKAMFSATPLRSYLKRLKQKDGVKKREECFKISKRMKTKSILKKLVDFTETHYWDDSFIGKELSEYLEAGVLRLKKASESEVTKELSAEVTEQQSEPQASTSQQSEPQPSTSQQSEPQASTSQQSGSQPSTSQVKVKDDEKREDNNQRVKLSQNQINGLILKLLSQACVGVTSVAKDIDVLNSKMDRLTETFRSEMIKVNSKIDRIGEACRVYYDPNFGITDDFCDMDAVDTVYGDFYCLSRHKIKVFKHFY